MLIQPPLLLPKSTKTLYLQTQPDLVLPLHQKLDVMMCHLSGDPSKVEVYRQTLYYSSPLGEKARKDNTSRTPNDGKSSVVQWKFIVFQHV